jgi:hypothetical protein
MVPATGSGADTVAVNVTDWFTSCGFIEDTRLVVVVFLVVELFTTWDNAVEVLDA